MKKLSSKFVLVLRTCNADMTSCGGFKWPKRGPVKCPDWSPTKACGNGLHGFLWGEGNGSLANFSADAKWLVVKVASDSVVDLAGKVKFPRGTVVFCGDRLSATNYIAAVRPGAIVGGTSTSGNYGTSTSGDYGTSTSGDRGTSTSGNHGTSTSGYRGTIVIKWHDGSRYRLAVGYVGEGGILPNVPYVVVDGKIVVK